MSQYLHARAGGEAQIHIACISWHWGISHPSFVINELCIFVHHLTSLRLTFQLKLSLIKPQPFPLNPNPAVSISLLL